MILKINGQARETEQQNVLELLSSLTIHPKTVVVELNGEIIGRDKYQSSALQNGDELEIVQMMAGG